jgi:hypothetical protein
MVLEGRDLERFLSRWNLLLTLKTRQNKTLEHPSRCNQIGCFSKNDSVRGRPAKAFLHASAIAGA